MTLNPTATCVDCGQPNFKRYALRCQACHYAHIAQSKENSPFPMNGAERARYGCTITFKNAAGELLTLHRPGPPLELVGPMCDEALGHDATYRVVSYSNPSTIHADMSGARSDNVGATGIGSRRPVPEKQILGRVNRLEMLHETLRLTGDEREVAMARELRRGKAQDAA